MIYIYMYIYIYIYLYIYILHDMFKARDASVWQRIFPVEVSALDSLFINIFYDVVARIERRCAIKPKYVL